MAGIASAVEATVSSMSGLQIAQSGRCGSKSGPLSGRGTRAVVLLASLTLGCSTLTPAAPSVGGVPRVIFPTLCKALFDYDDYDGSMPIVVLRESRPIHYTFALRVLHEAGAMTPAEADLDGARDEVLRELFRATVEIPESNDGCRWLRPGRPDAEYFGSDEFILELSNVTEDPFAAAAEHRFGVFARLSRGGAFGASWYWVPLERTGGVWRAFEAFELAISDG